MENVWHISDPSGISGQLIPPDLNASTAVTLSPWPPPAQYIWHTAPESHAKVQEIVSGNFPCWRVWLPNGTIENFGCTSDSRETYIDSGGHTVVWSWNLDLMIDRHGNQVHVNYQIHTNSDGSVRDAVLSQVSYDDPTCLNTTTSCSTWNPLVTISFDASRIIPNSQLTNPDCMNWPGNDSYRCDDPVDHSGSGGLPVPKVLNSFALKDVKVQLGSNLLREYVFSYEQIKPQDITDPVSGKTESISGYLDLSKIVQEGTNGTTLNAPVVTMSYVTKHEHYTDTAFLATPTTNCTPASWAPKNGAGQCYLWSRTYNARYLSNLDNGRGWNESLSWQEQRNNTHGVDSGAVNLASTCDGQETSTNLCGRADDENWSHMSVQSRTAVSNGGTSTWSYQYYIRTNWPAPPCGDCKQGYDWGNQNDADYADYYNGQFESFSHASVILPDSSQQIHRFTAAEGWGIAESSITCYAGNPPCNVAPYWDDSNVQAGKEEEADIYDVTGALLQVHLWGYASNCPPAGVPKSGHTSGPPNDPGDTAQLFSELDQNNPVAVCDPRVINEDTYQVDGVTDINGYLSNPNVVHKHIDYSHDTDDQGVSHYDYGNTNNIDISGNDLGGAHFVTHYTMYPNDNLGNNIYLTDLPAISQMQDGSGNPVSCSQSIYGSNSNATTAPTVPDVTQAQSFIVQGGCTGSLITVKHSYDSYGNPITATDGDNHQGCTSGSNSYSACASYDSAQTHLLTAKNAKNQTTTYSYSSAASGGFGQWLVSTTDVNGQITSYQYDVLGRLTAVIRPGDSSGSPTVTYTYTNTCTVGGTTPCLELDSSTRFSVGGPTSTVKQWYDGWGNLVETQTPSPTSGSTIVTYSLYDNMGREATKSLPYAISTPSGYVTPDQTKARMVTNYDSLGRSLGSITYSNATTIVLSTSVSYTVAQGVTGISSESSNAYEQTIVLDAYHHQGIGYTDALGRLRYTQVFSGTASPYSVVRTVGSTYDLLGNTTAVQTYDSTDAVQANHTATFDALSQLTGFNDSDQGSCSNTPRPPGCTNSSDMAWKFSYDADGNLLQQTDPRNQSIYASYDVLDRPLCRGTSQASVNPCSNSTYAQYFYDSYTNSSNPGVTFPAGCTAPTSPYASDPVGRPTAELFSSSAGSGWRCSGYDQRGELDQSTLSVTADSTTTTQTVNLGYNDGGELSSLVYPDGETLTSQYDTNGRFQSAYFGTPSTPDPVPFLVGQSTYTSNGQLASLALGGTGPKSGTPTPVFTENVGYDGIQRPQSVSATVGSSTIWNETRTYDNVGNVLQLASTVPTTGGGTLTDNQSFCYDALSRLVWAGNSGAPTGGDHCGNAPSGTTLSTYQQSLAYDSLDRLTTGPAGSEGYSDPNHVHAATTLGTIPNQYAAYDAMGNLTCRNVDSTGSQTCAGSSPTGAAMTYDNEGRLATWTAPSGTTATDSFLYDNEGNRVLQRVSTSSVTDIITFDGFTETTITGGTTTTIKYYSVGGLRVALKTNGTLSYLLSDGLGSSTIALTSTGSTQAVQLFAPYGTVRYSQGTMPTTYNYTGQRLDSQTGLLYYHARYYDPLAGRFTQADTVETNAGGMDAYAYVGNNPETKNDPTGHDGGGPSSGDPDWFMQLLKNPWFYIPVGILLSPEGAAALALIGGSIAIAAAPSGSQGPVYPPHGPHPDPAPTPGTPTPTPTPSTDTNGGMCRTKYCWDTDQQLSLASILNARASTARNQAIAQWKRTGKGKDPTGANGGAGQLQVVTSEGVSIFNNPVTRLGYRNGTHSEQQIIDWSIQQIEKLAKSVNLEGATINLLIFSQTEVCDTCQGQISTWLNELYKATGLSSDQVTINLYIWQSGNPLWNQPQYMQVYPETSTDGPRTSGGF